MKNLCIYNDLRTIHHFDVTNGNIYIRLMSGKQENPIPYSIDARNHLLNVINMQADYFVSRIESSTAHFTRFSLSEGLVALGTIGIMATDINPISLGLIGLGALGMLDIPYIVARSVGPYNYNKIKFYKENQDKFQECTLSPLELEKLSASGKNAYNDAKELEPQEPFVDINSLGRYSYRDLKLIKSFREKKDLSSSKVLTKNSTN